MATKEKDRAASVPATKVEMFSEVLDGLDWTSTRDMIARLDDADFWDDGFTRSAVNAAKAAYVHRMMRQVMDEHDFPLWASVEVLTIDGERQRVYKHESQFTVEDYEQVINYHKAMAVHHRRMASVYESRKQQRFGRSRTTSEVTTDGKAKKARAAAKGSR